MMIREFEFDLPYVPNRSIIKTYQDTFGVSIEDAKQMDYERNWKSKRILFRNYTRCMTSMIERLTQPIANDSYQKMIFECVDTLDPTYPKGALGVLVLQIKFDVDDFFAADNHDKKAMIVSAVKNYFEENASLLSFDSSSILDTCRIISENDYVNNWVWRKISRKDFGASQVVISHDCEVTQIKIEFLGNKSEIKTIVAVETKPDERDYARYLGKFYFGSNDDVVLEGKDGVQRTYPL